jgi:hypothetical protein
MATNTNRYRPSWRLLIITPVFFYTSYWFYREGVIYPDTVFFLIVGLFVLVAAFKV